MKTTLLSLYSGVDGVVNVEDLQLENVGVLRWLRSLSLVSIHVPCTIPTIVAGVNDMIYFSEIGTDSVTRQFSCRIPSVQLSLSTLTPIIEVLMNGALSYIGERPQNKYRVRQTAASLTVASESPRVCRFWLNAPSTENIYCIEATLLPGYVDVVLTLSTSAHGFEPGDRLAYIRFVDVGVSDAVVVASSDRLITVRAPQLPTKWLSASGVKYTHSDATAKKVTVSSVSQVANFWVFTCGMHSLSMKAPHKIQTMCFTDNDKRSILLDHPLIISGDGVDKISLLDDTGETLEAGLDALPDTRSAYVLTVPKTLHHAQLSASFVSLRNDDTLHHTHFTTRYTIDLTRLIRTLLVRCSFGSLIDVGNIVVQGSPHKFFAQVHLDQGPSFMSFHDANELQGFDYAFADRCMERAQRLKLELYLSDGLTKLNTSGFYWGCVLRVVSST